MAKTMTGVVVSNKGDKTIVVSVSTRKTHPLYKKQYSHSKKFMAHDETNDAGEGDLVIIAETKPLSARKRFTLLKITERAPVRHVEDVETKPVSKKKTDKEVEATTAPAKAPKSTKVSKKLQEDK